MVQSILLGLLAQVRRPACLWRVLQWTCFTRASGRRKRCRVDDAKCAALRQRRRQEGERRENTEEKSLSRVKAEEGQEGGSRWAESLEGGEARALPWSCRRRSAKLQESDASQHDGKCHPLAARTCDPINQSLLPCQATMWGTLPYRYPFAFSRAPSFGLPFTAATVFGSRLLK